ncbi:MAG: penicillin-insensitive murein endopeptidase [Myxococcota bacterium]
MRSSKAYVITALFAAAGCGAGADEAGPVTTPATDPTTVESQEVAPEPGETPEPVASEAPPVAPDPTEIAEPAPEEEPPFEGALSVEELLELSPTVSASVGLPNDGSIRGAVALPAEGPGLRSNPRRPNETGYWGTVEMVQALVRAAARVNEELPGSELTINDLGFPEGGPIPHHGSHQAGRDVDTLFYLLDEEGEPRQGKGVPIDPRGWGWDFNDLGDPDDDVRVRIDIPRTWLFLQALMEDETVSVQRIFVVEHIRTMLLDHARRIRAPYAARSLVSQSTCQPGSPHDDHLHIRFFCSAEDIGEGCEDSPPMYGWHRRALRAEGIEPVIARRRPRRRARTVSRQQARAEAPPMHARVRRFLAQREEWAEKPSPGRPFCP